MRSVYASWFIVVAFGLLGCNAKSTPGGPGAPKAEATKPALGQAEDTFRLTVPVLSTTIKQGETKATTLGIKRGKNFDEDVTVKFDNVPKGVTIDPPSPVIKHGDTEAKLTIKAADDAAVGEFTVKVTGHPTKGADASSEFKITVDKR
jgi:uncharacterized membrane protein